MFKTYRNDQRDPDLSSSIHFENSAYDLLDMTHDAAALLDFLKLEKAHLMGLGVGGLIAQLMSVHCPQKVDRLILMNTPCDLRPFNLALTNGVAEIGDLSVPHTGLSCSSKFSHACNKFNYGRND